MQRFSGHTVLVTGGASGIGAATVRAFLAEGASVVVTDANLVAAQALAAESEAADRCVPVLLDVTDRASVDAAVEEVARRTDRAAVLVNSAGVREIVPFLELEPETWRRVTGVNLDGVFNVSQAFVRRMTATGIPASIVNVASTAGLLAAPNRAAYVASKHAVVGLTRQMSLDLGRLGIRVNAVAPGVVRTPLTKDYFEDAELVKRLVSSNALGRVAEPEEVASVILFLSSNAASFVTGVIVPVDGGYTAGRER